MAAAIFGPGIPLNGWKGEMLYRNCRDLYTTHTHAKARRVPVLQNNVSVVTVIACAILITIKIIIGEKKMFRKRVGRADFCGVRV